MSYIFDSLDTFVTWFEHLSFSSIISTYWFIFFIEIPRYYLLEIIIVSYNVLTYRRQDKKRFYAHYRLLKENPLITILVPGKNEGKNIYKLVKSLAEQTYRNYEIIIVDDGSDDYTPLICSDLEKHGYIDLYLRCGVRGGKASAANYGAYHAKGKYIVHLDADSSLDRDAIENILLPFYLDPKIKAVGGTVKVRNYKDSICSSLQAIEYLKTIMIGRKVTDTLGILHIISGAFGAFEVETLKKVGYWDIGPGLDGDITQKIRKAGWKVAHASDAVCLTSVPVKWKVLFKQRLRWSKSLIRFRIRQHRDILYPNRNWSLSNFISNMESIVFDCVFNYIWLFYFIGLIANFSNHIFEVMLLDFIIRLCLAFVAFGVIMTVTERKREELFLIRFLPLTSLYTGYFMRIVRLLAHTKELFFFSSYKDPWNPEKTSRYAQLERA